MVLYQRHMGGVKRHASGRIHPLFVLFSQVNWYLSDNGNTFCTQLRKKFLHFVHEKGLRTCGQPSTLLERPLSQRAWSAGALAANTGMAWSFVVDAHLRQRTLAIEQPLALSIARDACGRLGFNLACEKRRHPSRLTGTSCAPAGHEGRPFVWFVWFSARGWGQLPAFCGRGRRASRRSCRR